MSVVLVVDDEPHLVRTLAINLRARDYEVETAQTADPLSRRSTRGSPTSSSSTSACQTSMGWRCCAGSERCPRCR